ncbi:MAG: hypothetical protein WDZ51_13685 [Pirellulaceae bacterium]
MSITRSDFEEFHRYATSQIQLGRECSLMELAEDWEKLRRWNEGNAISAEQSRQGQSTPLDLAEVLERVERRVLEK